MIHVKSVRYEANYTVSIEFTSGEWRQIDLGPHLWGPVFEPLKSVDYFQLVTVDPEAETLVWPNGADFAPVFLYNNSQPISQAVA
jgi:Protein of unknown function (DUF2442)